MRKETNSHKPAGQRRTTNCVSDLGQVILEGNAQTEEPLKVKKYTSACPVLGLVPAVSWDGRPSVLGLVARRVVPAPLLLFLGVCSPHGSLRTESHSRAFLPRQQASCLSGDTSSHEVPGVLRLWCSSRVALLCAMDVHIHKPE